MFRKSLGLMAFVLLNLAAGAQSAVSVKDSLKSLDSTTETAGVAYAPIVNHSAEWSIQPFRGFLLPHHYDMMAMYKHVNGIGFRYRAAMKAPEGQGAFRDKLTYGFTVNLMDLAVMLRDMA